MNTRRTTVTPLSFLVCLHLCLAASAHETNTHAWIGHQAILLLDQVFAPYPFVPNPVSEYRSVGAFSDHDYLDLMATPPRLQIGVCDADAETGTRLIEGMVEEDDNCIFNFHARDISWDDRQRSTQHFWLPDNAASYSQGLPLHSSALQKAQRLWRLALEEYLCNGNTNQAYWFLGRTAHLLQDMGSPAHVHLDQHLKGEDAFETWVGQTGPTGVPNYEKVTRFSAAATFYDPDTLPAYPLPTPPEFDFDLTTLFFNLASIGRQFDSDDSGHRDVGGGGGLFGTVRPSTVQAGSYNSFENYVNLGRDLNGTVPVVIWHRQTTNGNIASTSSHNTLNIDRDFECDDYADAGQDRLYLANSIAQAFDEDHFESVYDVLEVRTPVWTAYFDQIDDATFLSREHFVPTSVINRTNLPELVARSIGHTAQLLLNFWAKTIGDADIYFAISARGGNSWFSDDSTPGGNGGSVEIRAGHCGALDVGDGRDGDVNTSRTLGAGEYQFRQVVAGESALVLEVAGDVTIWCQYVFAPTYIVTAPGLSKTPSVTVYAGLSVEVEVDSQGILKHATPQRHGAVVDLEASNSEDGGHFTFWTTQLGSLRGSADVGGGGGSAGGAGGDGGTISVLVTGGQIAGSYNSDGGGADPSENGTLGAKGGNGGTIAIQARGLRSDLSLSADGGAGGYPDFPANPSNFGQNGTNGWTGGAGGAGGKINASLNLAAAHSFSISASAVGGNGAPGSNGSDGAAGASGVQSFPINGGIGGDGGEGGNGGAPGNVSGLNSSLANVSIAGGGGGNGGHGGKGGRGGYLNQQNGLGGDGGSGGKGGNSGGVGGALGLGGSGGVGGTARVSTNNGASGPDGLDGGVGASSPGTPGALPDPCQCGMRGATGSGLFRILEPMFGQGMPVAFATFPDKTNYVIEASSDLKTWTTITNITTTELLIHVLDNAATNQNKRFYRARAQ